MHSIVFLDAWALESGRAFTSAAAGTACTADIPRVRGHEHMEWRCSVQEVLAAMQNVRRVKTPSAPSGAVVLRYTVRDVLHHVRGSVVAKALCYKAEGRGFEPDEVSLPNPSGRTRLWDCSRPLT
jgi:hypothetical protein